MRREDTWRSLKRWLALAFTDPWTIRLEQAQYVEEERPLIVVEPIGDMNRTGVQPTIPSRPQVVAQTFVITAYPALVDDPREARVLAEETLWLLDEIVTVGWVEDDVPVGGPLRIPVWDYEAVPVGGPDRGNAHALDEWSQMAWVETWNGLTIPDPQDDRRFTVPYTLRLSWQADSRYVPGDPVQGFGGRYVPAPDVPMPPAVAPPGPPSASGASLWEGHGPPDPVQLPDAQSGDEYVDLDTGDLYLLP